VRQQARHGEQRHAERDLQDAQSLLKSRDRAARGRAVAGSAQRLFCRDADLQRRKQARDERGPGAAYGSGRRRTALTTLNTAVVTPMPSARMDTAAVVNRRCLSRMRSPNRKSCHMPSIQPSRHFDGLIPVVVGRDM
jgi:hypothetical protein